MIPYLQPLKESVWIRITALALFCGLSSVAIWIIFYDYLSVGIIFAALISGIFTILAAFLLGKVTTEYALKPTDFLASAILLVTREENQVPEPDPNGLDSSKEFLVSLAKNVYELVSDKPSSKIDESELPFYRTVINTLPLPIIVLGKGQHINFANDSALHYVNLPANEVIDKPLYDALNLSFVSSLTLESWLSECAKNAVTENEIWERVRLDLANNKRKQFDMVAHYSKNDPNGIETILVLFDRTLQYERDDHDLTFISLAVHELRTPLTIMRGYIEVFEDELSANLNNEQTAFMHNMGASAQQLTSFVSNILNVARVEENSLPLRLKEENWKEVLTNACKDMELRARVHNKKLIFDISDDLPTIAVDKVCIYEVMSNLIDNAIKYTHTDENIKISSYVKDGQIETTVTDKGVGIPIDSMDHLFDKFYRAHQNKNSIGGTGLGLYLSRAIIVAHGGNIWVRSKEGEGSTFGFTLPIYSSVADQIKNEDNSGIVRGAHGWIKNHSLYRE